MQSYVWVNARLQVLPPRYSWQIRPKGMTKMGADGPLHVRRPRKIAREHWAGIAARHADGESMASIARAYQCTAPAIRYIVRQRGQSQHAQLAPDGEEHAPLAAQPEPGKVARSRAVAGAPVPQMPQFDPGLREAITLEIARFLVAFDAVLGAPDPAGRDRLRDAIDRLMRAAARVRIELEGGAAL
jgi:transposase-like protein